MLFGTIVDKTSKKDVSVKTTSHKKIRASICLSALAIGKKSEPFIAFGNAKESKSSNDEYSHKCVI